MPSPRVILRCPARALVYAAVFAAVLSRARAASAQTGGDQPDAAFRPTRGVFIPGAARAGDADASAVELNPGQLPLLRGGAAAIVGDLWRSEAAMPGRGGALLLATPLWKGSGVGAGLQSVGAGAGASTTKLQFAAAFGGRNGGLGASWAHLFGDGVGGTDTFDLGLGVRPISRAALGLVIEDVARPRLPGAPDRLPRRWVGDLVLRPLATDRIELGVGALHVGGDRWSLLESRFRLAFRIAGGWHVFGELERAPRRTGLALSPVVVDSGIDWRATVGVGIDFDHGRLLVAGRLASTPSTVGGDNWGASAVWHGSTERNPEALGPANVVRVSLREVESDRAFLKLALELRALARDTDVSAVLLRLDGLEIGLGRLEELRDLIGEIRRHGKPVVAYLGGGSMRDLYLASACDRIVMHPAAELSFAGVAGVVTFYKGAMDRLGVAVDLVRVAELKGAMEPFIMNESSAPVRKNKNDLIDDVYNRMLDGIGAGRAANGAPTVEARSLGPKRLRELVELGVFTPVEAQAAGLVDAVRDDSEVEDYLKEILGRRSIAIHDPDRSPVRPARWAGSRIAVVLIDGTITEGKSENLPLGLGGGVAGADTLVDALDECRRDPGIAAVVLRVNSPGGSAFSSDVIARAVARVRAAGKPVVTSMGDVAASGGYYVAAPTDLIFAEPSTTTGSIGVFGFKLDVSRLLAALSINVEVFRRGAHADQLSPFRPWTETERQTAERKIRYLYGLFTSTVAAGRRSRGLTTPERVDQIGRGHVWTGSQARGIGLVDELGGVTAAIDRAVALGKVPVDGDLPPELVVLPRSNATIVQKLVGLASVDASGTNATADDDSSGDDPGGAPSAASPAALLRPLRPALRLAAPYLLGPGEGIEARIPFDLDIR